MAPPALAARRRAEARDGVLRALGELNGSLKVRRQRIDALAGCRRAPCAGSAESMQVVRHARVSGKLVR